MFQDATLFGKFGGIRPMAKEVNEAPSTVQSWRDAGRIPAAKQPDVLLRARQLKLPVSALDVIFPLGILDEKYADLAADRLQPELPFSDGDHCGETGKGRRTSAQTTSL